MVSRRRSMVSCPIHLQNAHPSLINDEEIHLNGVLVIAAIWNQAVGFREKLTPAPAKQSGNPEGVLPVSVPPFTGRCPTWEMSLQLEKPPSWDCRQPPLQCRQGALAQSWVSSVTRTKHASARCGQQMTVRLYFYSKNFRTIYVELALSRMLGKF